MTASPQPTDGTRRRTALVLVGGGALALAALLVLMPPPAKFDQLGVSVPRDDASAWFAARGPPIARYDAEADLTEAVFRCSHGHCPHAVRFAGDQRASLDRPHVLLRATGGPFEPTPMAAPIPLGDNVPPGNEVTSALAGEWRAFSPWLGAALLATVGAALAAGLVLLTRMPRAAAYAAPVAAALALVAARETNWMTLFLFPMFGLPVLALVGGTGALVARRRPGWRAVPWACLVFALVFLPLTMALNAYFPTAPEL